MGLLGSLRGADRVRCPLCGTLLTRDADGNLACPSYGVVGEGLPDSEAFEHFPATPGLPAAGKMGWPSRSGLDLEALAWRVFGGRK